jgi:hypothetical protein
MPRVGGKAGAGSACVEAIADAFVGVGNGFGEGPCSCARCMRKSPPLREDVS